jgi:hypothetical protein
MEKSNYFFEVSGTDNKGIQYFMGIETVPEPENDLEEQLIILHRHIRHCKDLRKQLKKMTEKFTELIHLIEHKIDPKKLPGWSSKVFDLADDIGAGIGDSFTVFFDSLVYDSVNFKIKVELAKKFENPIETEKES